MSGFDDNPFADPFADKFVQQHEHGKETNQATLEDFNPFGPSTSTADSADPPAVVVPSGPPPTYKNYGSSENNLSAPPVPAPAPAPVIPGHEELLRQQEELERKAEELQRREESLASPNYQPRKNNWPPLPKWSPVGPCFYQDFAIDIPAEFTWTVRMVYYLWIFHAFSLFVNIFACLAIFIVDQEAASTGPQFGLSILWFVINTPLSLCWYRPLYSAFRNDSSFRFFWFFFILFFQIILLVVMSVGIPGSGWTGWIVTVSQAFPKSVGVGIFCAVVSVFFTFQAVVAVILLKKVHSIYRSTGASFEKAQQEFSTGVMKNQGVRNVAAGAVESTIRGSY